MVFFFGFFWRFFWCFFLVVLFDGGCWVLGVCCFFFFFFGCDLVCETKVGF